MLIRTAMPEAQPLQHFDITQALTYTLPNGIPLHIINAGEQDIVKIELIFNAGNYFEWLPAQAFLTAKMLIEGTKNLSAAELAEKFAFYGSQLECHAGNDKLSVSFTAISKSLPFLLPILREVINESAIPKDSFNDLQRIQGQNLRVNYQKTSFVATGLFKKNIFGEIHPYGYFITPANIEKMMYDEIVSYYHSKIQYNSFEIVASGKINDAAIQEIYKHLGVDKSKFPIPVSIKKESRGSGKVKIYEPKPDALQSSIRIGRKLLTKNHPDYLKLIVVNEILGGYFGSRLMKNVREEKGLTYGIYSQIASMQHEGYFVIATDVKKELVESALNEIYAEVKKLQETPVPDDELQTVKNYLWGKHLSSITTPFSLAEKFKAVHFSGLSYDFYTQYYDTIQKISAKDIQSLAQKYFDISSLYEVVVG